MPAAYTPGKLEPGQVKATVGIRHSGFELPSCLGISSFVIPTEMPSRQKEAPELATTDRLWQYSPRFTQQKWKWRKFFRLALPFI